MGDPDQEAARAILREMCRATGLTPTGLAKAAGMRPSTLTRFLNNPDIKHTLSMRTMRKLQAVIDKHQALRAYQGTIRSKPARRRKPTLRVVAPAKRKGGRQK